MAIFAVLAVLLCVFLMYAARSAFEMRFVPAVAVGICLSWIPMQIMAIWWEHRWLWPPSTQYASFFWGDLVWLPLCLGALAVLTKKAPLDGLQNHFGWQLFAFIVAVAAGFGLHHFDAANYSASALNSPTKLWHDCVSTVVWVFALVSQAPVLYYGWLMRRWRPIALAILSLAAFFYLVVAYDPTHPGTDAHRDYNWSTFQTVSEEGVR